MTHQPDYYQLLQVLPDAPDAIIKASYRAHMQKLGMHPDLGGDPDVAAKLNVAYQVLSDPAKRHAYDLSLKQQSNKKPRQATRPVETQKANPYQPAVKHRCPFCQAGVLDKNLNEHSRCRVCRSPLLPVTKLAVTSDHCQRDIFRIEQDKRIAFYTIWPQENPYPGIIRDHSPNGMQLLSPVIVETGERIKFFNKTMQGIAECVNSQKDAQQSCYRLGFSFVTLDLALAKGNFLSLST